MHQKIQVNTHVGVSASAEAVVVYIDAGSIL